MTFKERSPSIRLLCAGIAAFSLISCSSATKGSGGTISKVKPFFLDPTVVLRTPDPAIVFERESHLRGAYTAAEQVNRSGTYYSIFWKVDDRSQPVTVRFEYRQANTALAVKTLEQEVASVKRNNLTKFQVTGAEYTVGGRVSAWRVSLVRGKEVLVTQQSYLWE